MAKLLPANLFSKSIYHFYVAAHYESFTKAAQYLHVGQSAVSHAIKDLESQWNVELFHRRHRHVQLSDRGKLLFQSLQIGKIPIEQVLHKIKNGVRDESRVTLSVSTATAVNLILPKITEFKKRYPLIDIKVITNDNDIDYLQDNVDLAIPLSNGPWKQYQSWHFADEEIVAVCSPDYAKKHVHDINTLTPYDINGLNLIHADEKSKTRLDWQDWFNYFDKSLQVKKDGLSFTDYSIALQSCINDQGVALGWKHLIKPLLADKKLIALGTHKVCSDNPFVILEISPDMRTESIVHLRQWLMGLTD